MLDILKPVYMGRMGGGGGMGGGACYTYPDAPATPGLTTADITFSQGIYMNGSMRMMAKASSSGDLRRMVVEAWGDGWHISVTPYSCHSGAGGAYQINGAGHDVAAYDSSSRH